MGLIKRFVYFYNKQRAAPWMGTEPSLSENILWKLKSQFKKSEQIFQVILETKFAAIYYYGEYVFVTQFFSHEV